MPKLLEEIVVNSTGERMDRIFVLYDNNGKVLETFVNKNKAISALKAELKRNDELKKGIYSDLGLGGNS